MKKRFLHILSIIVAGTIVLSSFNAFATCDERTAELWEKAVRKLEQYKTTKDENIIDEITAVLASLLEHNKKQNRSVFERAVSSIPFKKNTYTPEIGDVVLVRRSDGTETPGVVVDILRTGKGRKKIQSVLVSTNYDTGSLPVDLKNMDASKHVDLSKIRRPSAEELTKIIAEFDIKGSWSAVERLWDKAVRAAGRGDHRELHRISRIFAGKDKAIKAGDIVEVTIKEGEKRIGVVLEIREKTSSYTKAYVLFNVDRNTLPDSIGGFDELGLFTAPTSLYREGTLPINMRKLESSEIKDVFAKARIVRRNIRWRLSDRWEGLNPPEGYIPYGIFAFREGRLGVPSEGWKLHVSASMEDAPAVLELVLPELCRMDVSHKFVKDPPSYLYMSYALGGIQNGKLITIYPHSSDEAMRIAKRLHELLKGRGFRAPPVQGEITVGDTGLIYARYGGFTKRTITSPSGEEVRDVRGRAHPEWIENIFKDFNP